MPNRWRLLAASLTFAGCAHARPGPEAPRIERPSPIRAAWAAEAIARLPRAMAAPGGRAWRIVERAEKRPHGTGREPDEIYDGERHEVFVYDDAELGDIG